MSWFRSGAVGENEKSTVGSAPAPTFTDLLVDTARPKPSTTVSVTVYACTRVKKWLGVRPVATDPSPKSQLKATMALSGSIVLAESNTTTSPCFGVAGLKVKSGTNLTFGRMTPGGIRMTSVENRLFDGPLLPIGVAPIVI